MRNILTDSYISIVLFSGPVFSSTKTIPIASQVHVLGCQGGNTALCGVGTHGGERVPCSCEQGQRWKVVGTRDTQGGRDGAAHDATSE